MCKYNLYITLKQIIMWIDIISVAKKLIFHRIIHVFFVSWQQKLWKLDLMQLTSVGRSILTGKITKKSVIHDIDYFEYHIEWRSIFCIAKLRIISYSFKDIHVHFTFSILILIIFEISDNYDLWTPTKS